MEDGWFTVEYTPREKLEELIALNGVKRRNEERINGARSFTNFISEMYPNAHKILDVGVGPGNTSIFLKNKGYDVTAMDRYDSVASIGITYGDGTTEERFYQNADFGYKKKLTDLGIEFKEEYFTLDTDIREYDLVIGLHACGANELIVRRCLQEKKEFVITPCEIRNSMTNRGFLNRASYIAYLKRLSAEIKSIDLPINVPSREEPWGKTLYLKK